MEPGESLFAPCPLLPSTCLPANLVGYNRQECPAPASIQKQLINCGWRSASSAVPFLFSQASCKSGIHTQMVNRFSPIVRFAILPT